MDLTRASNANSPNGVAAHLLNAEGNGEMRAPDRQSRATVPLRQARRLAEQEAITLALREHKGQVPAAAASLAISRAQMYRLISKLGIKPDHAIRAGNVGGDIAVQ